MELKMGTGVVPFGVMTFHIAGLAWDIMACGSCAVPLFCCGMPGAMEVIACVPVACVNGGAYTSCIGDRSIGWGEGASGTASCVGAAAAVPGGASCSACFSSCRSRSSSSGAVLSSFYLF